LRYVDTIKALEILDDLKQIFLTLYPHANYFQKHEFSQSTLAAVVKVMEGTESIIREHQGSINIDAEVAVFCQDSATRQRKKLRHGIGKGGHDFGEKPEEAATFKHIQEWQRLGLTAKEIAIVLNRDGHGSRSGKPWLGTTVAKILRRMEAA